MKHKYIIIVIGLLVPFSCENNLPELTNVKWELSAFEQENATILSRKDFIVNTQIENYNIDYSDSNRFVGTVSTNWVGGEYIVGEKKSIRMYNIGTTYVGIPNGSHSHEYFSALKKVNSYKLYFNSLTLFYGENKRKIVFERG